MQDPTNRETVVHLGWGTKDAPDERRKYAVCYAIGEPIIRQNEPGIPPEVTCRYCRMTMAMVSAGLMVERWKESELSHAVMHIFGDMSEPEPERKPH